MVEALVESEMRAMQGVMEQSKEFIVTNKFIPRDFRIMVSRVSERSICDIRFYGFSGAISGNIFSFKSIFVSLCVRSQRYERVYLPSICRQIAAATQSSEICENRCKIPKSFFLLLFQMLFTVVGGCVCECGDEASWCCPLSKN